MESGLLRRLTWLASIRCARCMHHIHLISGPPRRVPGFSRRVAPCKGLRRGRAALSVALWRDDELRSALPRSNRPYGTALIKKSSLASSGGTSPYFEYVTDLGVRRRNMKSLLRPIVRDASMEAIVLAAYSDDSLDRESVGHEKAISRQKPRFSSQSNEFFGMY